MTQQRGNLDEVEQLEQALGPLRALIADKTVFVLGSAPQASIELFEPTACVVTCNASARQAHRLGLPEPLLTVLDNEVLDPDIRGRKPERCAIVNQGLLAGLNLGHLVTVQSNRALAGSPDVLGATLLSVQALDRAQRSHIVQRASGFDPLDATNWSMVSTGAFAIALCVYLGARRVNFAGFGLNRPIADRDPPHFYARAVEPGAALPDAGVDSRNHSMADAALVACLALRGVFVDTRDPDFRPLVQNWGSRPPAWAIRPNAPRVQP